MSVVSVKWNATFINAKSASNANKYIVSFDFYWFLFLNKIMQNADNRLMINMTIYNKKG